MASMPLFEFHCTDCRNNFELLVREKTVLACPSCHSTQLEKQLSVFAVGAKGSASPARMSGPAACGACGDPRGPGSCSN